MGIELTLCCRTHRHQAWLGSMKPWKWAGYQLGNRWFAELLAAHVGCDLVLVDDAGGPETFFWTARWGDPGEEEVWQEDLRSRHCWDSLQAGEGPVVCGGCGKPVDEARSLQVGRYLWCCDVDCRSRCLDPYRVFQPGPGVVPLRVDCQACAAGVSIAPGQLGDLTEVAEFLDEHRLQATTLMGDGCRLRVTRLQSPTVPSPVR